MRALVGVLALALAVTACRNETPPADRPAAPQPSTPAAPELGLEAPRLLPPATHDSAFEPFRRRLLRALAERDTAFLFGMLDPTIKNSFGGDDSIAGFRRIWRMDETETAVWAALRRVLELGGGRDGGYYIAPYVFTAWPDSLDPFTHVAVTGARVDARTAPDAAAPPAGVLNYRILPFEEWRNLDESGVATAESWARVRLPDGRSVWVNGLDVYSPVGWRAFFQARPDRWVLTIFVAGD